MPGGTDAELVKEERPIPSGLKQSHEPCMICFDAPSMMMPCKHKCHPHCLVNYAWSEVSNKKVEIKCPICEKEWSIVVIKKYGQTTDEEMGLLEEGLSRNAIVNDPNISECPGCRSYCERINKANIRVTCRICKKNGKADFCWHCKRSWTGSSSTECGYADCNVSSILAQIKDAPIKEVVGVKCPSIRLCPRCGAAIEHKSNCKHMTCKTLNCNAQFCFICLRIRQDGSWQCGSYNTPCSPAPLQETVPRL